MKKLTIILAILFAVNASAQNQSEEKRIGDSIYRSIPDSVGFISKRHLSEVDRRVSQQLTQLEDKLTVTEYKRLVSSIEAVFSDLIGVGVEDYKKRKKPVK